MSVEESVEYEKPKVERIDLALDETLSAGCKVGGTACDTPFPGALRRWVVTSGITHLNVGPVRFLLRWDNATPVTYDAWGYRDFVSRPSASEVLDPLVEIDVRICSGAADLPVEPPLYESGSNWAVWSDADYWLFYSRYAGRERPGYCCRVARDMTQAVLWVADDLVVNPLCYPLDQILAWGLLSKCGGLVMHSALVAREGSGLVLAGRSGAGKSTLAELCRQHGWRGLNDDRAMLYQRDGRARAAGTPWHGTGKLAESGEVLPSAILLLEQSGTNRLEAVSAREARLALLDVTSIPWFEDAWSQGALDALEALVESVPVYRYCFTPTSSAACALDGLTEGVIC